MMNTFLSPCAYTYCTLKGYVYSNDTKYFSFQIVLRGNHYYIMSICMKMELQHFPHLLVVKSITS